MGTEKFETLQDIIVNRRSIGPHMFRDEQVPMEQLMTALENANWAPSHKNTEPWRFRVITGKGKHRFADFVRTNFENSKVDIPTIKIKKSIEKIELSSHILAITIQHHPESGLPEWEELAAVACAVQNFWLSLHALGMTGYWSTPKLHMEQFYRFASMNENEQSLGFFYVGFPQQTLSIPKTKGDFQDKIQIISS